MPGLCSRRQIPAPVGILMLKCSMRPVDGERGFHQGKIQASGNRAATAYISLVHFLYSEDQRIYVGSIIKGSNYH